MGSLTSRELESLTRTILSVADILRDIVETERPQSLGVEWCGEPHTAVSNYIRANSLANMVILQGPRLPGGSSGGEIT